MHGDPKFSKFFLYLNLFIFSMTILVLGENLLVTFLGWEGVGTCSYLSDRVLAHRESAATAGKKAFITNRVGDFGVMLAMFLSFSAVGSLSYTVLNESAGPANSPHRRRRRSPPAARSALPARAHSCRSTSGCPTPWRARPRCRR